MVLKASPGRLFSFGKTVAVNVNEYTYSLHNAFVTNFTAERDLNQTKCTIELVGSHNTVIRSPLIIEDLLSDIETKDLLKTLYKQTQKLDEELQNE